MRSGDVTALRQIAGCFASLTQLAQSRESGRLKPRQRNSPSRSARATASVRECTAAAVLFWWPSVSSFNNRIY